MQKYVHCLETIVLPWTELQSIFFMIKGHLGLHWEDYQHAMIDEFLCMVGGWLCCGDRCMSLVVKKKVNMVQGQLDGPLELTLKGDNRQTCVLQFWDVCSRCECILCSSKQQP